MCVNSRHGFAWLGRRGTLYADGEVKCADLRCRMEASGRDQRICTHSGFKRVVGHSCRAFCILLSVARTARLSPSGGMADTEVSKTSGGNLVRVRPSPRAPYACERTPSGVLFVYGLCVPGQTPKSGTGAKLSGVSAARRGFVSCIHLNPASASSVEAFGRRIGSGGARFRNRGTTGLPVRPLMPALIHAPSVVVRPRNANSLDMVSM